jgi:hypothetical protein
MTVGVAASRDVVNVTTDLHGCDGLSRIFLTFRLAIKGSWRLRFPFEKKSVLIRKIRANPWSLGFRQH